MTEAQFDWEQLDTRIAELIYENGCGYLETQLQMSVAADQRTMTLAGILTTVSIATLGVAIGLINYKENLALTLAASTTGIFLMLGAWCALMASRPGKIYYPTVRPGERLSEKAWLKFSAKTALISEAFNQQLRITANEEILAGLLHWYRDALWFTASAPIAGFVVWGVVLVLEA